jgi:hypothetical protein
MKWHTTLGIAWLASWIAAGCAPTNQAPSTPAAGQPRDEALTPAEPAEAPQPETQTDDASLALSPLAAYEDVDRRIHAVLSTVTDGPSANAAADALPPLTAELKLTLRPYLAALAAMPDAARSAYLQRKMEEGIQQKRSGTEYDHRQVIEVARQPGNERFKAALESLFQTMIDEGSTGIRRSTTRWLEQLNRP